MKAIAINGSPRKGWNTEKLLKSALKGAGSAGAETRMIHLYDLNYTGCTSCFGCKRKGKESSICIVKDELKPVLDEIFQADALFIGSPIYFGDMTGEMISFMERLGFPLLSYDNYSKIMFEGKVNAAVFCTMNVPEKYYRSGMEERILSRASLLNRLGGKVEVYSSCDTYQFSDYKKYHAGLFDEAQKREVRETQFPKDLIAAFEIGKKLMEI